MRKVLPLKGHKSLVACGALGKLLLGLFMLPIHLQGKQDYNEYFEGFKTKSDEEKEKLIRQAVLLVELAEDEVKAFMSFTVDKNGVEYSSVNLANVGPDEMHECIVAVCMELSRIEINLVSDAEKKKLQILA